MIVSLIAIRVTIVSVADMLQYTQMVAMCKGGVGHRATIRRQVMPVGVQAFAPHSSERLHKLRLKYPSCNNGNPIVGITPKRTR